MSIFLLLAIDAILLLAHLLATILNVLFLLSVSHDPWFKGGSLTGDFGRASLYEFYSLAEVRHSYSLLALLSRARG